MQAKYKQTLPGLCLALLISALSIHSTSVLAAGSREAAAEEAMVLHGQAGKVLSIREKTSDQGSNWYEVKILTDGNVSVYRIPQD